MEASIGYHETPKNGDGVIRARTMGQLRAWLLPRRLSALEALNRNFGGGSFPGLYILFSPARKTVYVGEAKSVYARLKTHFKAPEKKIKDWKEVLVVNDGRLAFQSDFNDAVVRKALEAYLIKLMRLNKYRVVSQGEPQRLNPFQETIVQTLVQELNFLLLKRNVITKQIEKGLDKEVMLDEIWKLLEKKKYHIDRRGVKDAYIDGRKAFIRPGSKKPQGWQVTVRGKKPGSFIDCLHRGEGFLLMPRGGGLLIPLREIKKVVEKDAYKHDTIDVFIEFREERVLLKRRNREIEVTECRI